MIDDTNNENTEAVTDAGESADAPATEAGQGLSINDLANIKNIIDVASQRGAFRANEMVVVGTTYDRLLAFLKSVLPAAETTEDADGTDEASDEVADDTAGE